MVFSGSLKLPRLACGQNLWPLLGSALSLVASPDTVLQTHPSPGCHVSVSPHGHFPHLRRIVLSTQDPLLWCSGTQPGSQPPLPSPGPPGLSPSSVTLTPTTPQCTSVAPPLPRIRLPQRLESQVGTWASPSEHGQSQILHSVPPLTVPPTSSSPAVATPFCARAHVLSYLRKPLGPDHMPRLHRSCLGPSRRPPTRGAPG